MMSGVTRVFGFHRSHVPGRLLSLILTLAASGAASTALARDTSAGPAPPPVAGATGSETGTSAPAKTASPRAAAAPGRATPAPRPPGRSALGGTSARTRFIIGLEKAAPFQVFSLSRPNRVVVELPSMRLDLPPADKPVGLVRDFRGGLVAAKLARIVIDVTAPVIVERAEIEGAKSGNPQLVLDIVPVTSASTRALSSLRAKAVPAALGAAGVQPPLPKRAASPKGRAERMFRPLIVLDPGHGGHDSGAKKNGVVEKDAVLAFALVLRDKLLATRRYRVLMTRDTDVFVDLDERREIAERAKAALFIAIHADYAGSHARGATIYSLTESSARSLQRSAKGEVKREVLSSKEIAQASSSARGDVDAVRSILADFAAREVEVTRSRTSLFTQSVIETMGTTTSMRQNPDRQAAFRVLQTAKLPSVLIELAYVTNREDAMLLRSDDWRRKVSASILVAIDNYFSHHAVRLPM
jgi:N-acetylmuramoyl-L-alanine amidase